MSYGKKASVQTDHLTILRMNFLTLQYGKDSAVTPNKPWYAGKNNTVETYKIPVGR